MYSHRKTSIGAQVYIYIYIVRLRTSVAEMQLRRKKISEKFQKFFYLVPDSDTFVEQTRFYGEHLRVSLKLKIIHLRIWYRERRLQITENNKARFDELARRNALRGSK